ncbi:MAG: peptidoglycan editing factor PgeF [Erysipelotrichaceae bacterium]
MSYKLYQNDEQILCGYTKKDFEKMEQHNFALHVCKDSHAILHNRLQFCKAFHLKPEQFSFLHQTHSANAIKITQSDAERGFFDAEDALQAFDACYTLEKNHVIGVFTADCVPILFWDPTKQLVGAIHAGWQSSAQNIVQKTLTTLQDVEGCDLHELRVWIGPSISQANFEVGQDVVDAMQQLPIDITPFYQTKQNSKYQMDVAKINKALLVDSGVLVANIQHDTTCTFADDACFSYREERTCGRHFHFIMQKEAID